MWAYYISLKPNCTRFDVVKALGDYRFDGDLGFKIPTAQTPTVCFEIRNRLPQDVKRRFYNTETNEFTGVTEIEIQ